MSSYYTLPIILFMLLMYVISYFLQSDGTIKEGTLKLFWNIFLILASIFVALTGIFMVTYINLEILPIDNTVIFWHVEAGILTSMAGIFHIHLYRKQFNQIFRLN